MMSIVRVIPTPKTYSIGVRISVPTAIDDRLKTLGFNGMAPSPKNVSLVLAAQKASTKRREPGRCYLEFFQSGAAWTRSHSESLIFTIPILRVN